MTSIYIQLLNHLRVTVDDVPINKFRSDKARAMLAYVAAQADQTHSRRTLATLLWPELPEKTAKTNLRSVLSNLRKIVPNGLIISRQSVTLSADVVVDVSVVRAAIAKGELAAAANGYTGEFLRGFTLGDAVEFDDWASLTRESLHIAMMQTFDRLLTQQCKAQQWAQVIPYARQQLQLEAWHEPAHRALLQALMAQGLVQEARAQYERCRAVMDEEFRSEPSLATQTLWHDLNQSDGEAVHLNHNLPQLLTPFFGRSRERDHLTKLLAKRDRRLITLTGQGGSGKTRLALEVAHAQRSNFAAGVWFVQLAGLISADAIIPAIADALDIQFVGERPLTEQLYARLHDKELLLILDNLEHLPAEVADIIAALLQATTRLIVLATTRIRLQLRIETLVPLAGLPVPTEDATDPDSFAAVELFADQMQRLNPFAQPDAAQMGKICALVAGLPLGIELAAAQTDRLSLDEIIDALQLSLANAAVMWRDVPERQRSLRAVFDSSWVLLTAAQQQALAQLSVFRGAFRFSAVRAIVDKVDKEMMRSLIQHSLVQVVDGRYLIHEIVREFSAEKAPPEIADQHSRYYLTIARDLMPQWDGMQFSAALERGRVNWDNLNAAWQHAIKIDAQTPATINAMRALFNFRGLYRQGATQFAAAATSTNDPRIRAWLLAAQAHFLVQRIDSERAMLLIDEALQIAKAHADLPLQLDLQITQQIIYSNQSRFADCIALAEPIIAAAQMINQSLIVAHAQFHAGYAKVRSGELIAGRDLLQAARDSCQRDGNVLYQIMAARHLGMAQLFLGELESAEKTLSAARELAIKRQDREREMFVYAVLGPVYLQMGDLSRAAEIFQEQIAFAQLTGREADIALNQANLSNTLMELGRYDEAFERINIALPIMERSGDRANVAVAQCVVGSVCFAQGEAETAAEWLMHACQVNAEVGAQHNEAGTRAALGDIYLALNRPKLARTQFHESHRIASEIGDQARVCVAQVGMAQAALDLDDPTLARRIIDEILENDHWKTAYNSQERAFGIYSILGALGDDRAPQILQHAYDFLQDQADRISDDLYRHSFLHNVPLHRAILAEYAGIERQ